MLEVSTIVKWNILGSTPLEDDLKEEISFTGDTIISFNGRTVIDIIDRHCRLCPDTKVETDIIEDKEYYLYLHEHSNENGETRIYKPDGYVSGIEALIINVSEPISDVKELYTEVIIFEL